MFLNKRSLDDKPIYADDRSDQAQNSQSQGNVHTKVGAIESRLKNPDPYESNKVEDNNILIFEDLDDEDDDIQPFNSALQQQKSPLNSTQDQRQRINEQQKQSLLKLNQASQNVQVNQDFIKKLGQNRSTYHQSDEIDYDKLQQNNTAYEPGQFQYNIGGQLPNLVRLENQAPQQYNEDSRAYQNSSQKQSQSNGIVMKQRSTNYQEEQKQIKSPDKKQAQQIDAQSLTDSDDDGTNQKEAFIQIQDDQDQPGSERINQETIVQDLDANPANHEDKTLDKDQIQQVQAQQKKLPYPKPLISLNLPDMKYFLTNPCPKGGMIQCTIKRDKSGMGRFYPRYLMHLSTGYQFLMIAKKRACNNTSNYIVSMNRNKPEEKSSEFLGKVRSNFLGTEFVLFDSGESPIKARTSDEIRKELGVVLYESNLMGAKGPRKMRILLPKVSVTNQSPEFRPKTDKEGILCDYKSGNVDGLTVYVNRQPKWNDVVQAFVLNFYGRVDKPSVKNFQLIEQGMEDNIFLQFGRIGDEMFNLDFQWPLSPLQAFEIAISSFDYKIACE